MRKYLLALFLSFSTSAFALESMWTVENVSDLNLSNPVGTMTYVNSTDTVYINKVSGYEQLGNRSMTTHLANFDHTQIGGLTAGLVVLTLTSCPAGYTELPNVGYYIQVTNASNGDVNTTGGSLSYTPAGGVAAPTWTGDSKVLTGNSTKALTMDAKTPTGNLTSAALTMDAKVLTGNVTSVGLTIDAITQVINHTHPVLIRSNNTAGTACIQGGTTAGNANISGAALANTTGGVASITPTGNLTAKGLTIDSNTPTGNITSKALTMDTVTPTGNLTSSTLTIDAFTPTGNNTAPAFTGTPATITPTFRKFILCQKD